MASYEIMRYSDGVWITYMDLSLTRIKSIGPFKLKCEAERELEVLNKKNKVKTSQEINELGQLRNFIDRRIKALDNEIIQHSLVLEFDECKTKHAVCDELHDIKAELNRFSWLSMESKLEVKK